MFYKPKCVGLVCKGVTLILNFKQTTFPLTSVCVCVCVWSVFRKRGGEKVSTLHSSTGPVGRAVQEPSSTIPHAIGMLTD